MKSIVVALGGNALGNNPTEQLKLVKNTAKSIVDLVSEGYNVVVSHGNGPQVGMINLAFENSSKEEGMCDMPFPECGAMSQGYIGYHLQQAIQEELRARSINRNCATVITQVLVDKKDQAFNNPEKPIGAFYTEEEAKKIEKSKGYTFVEDSGRGYRRVVPSPKPKEIIELGLIKDLLNQGNIVIVSGGGGIPVVKEGKELKGVAAVIDKDRSSALLAKELHADILLILTTVETVCLKYNTVDQINLRELDSATAKKYMKSGEFKKGSMLPKVESCVDFCESTGGIGIITSLECALPALNNETGTIIRSSQKGGKKMAKTKKKKERMSAFSIIFLLIAVLAVFTYLLPSASFDSAGEIINGSGVVKAKLSDVLMSPIYGFENAVDVAIFVLILGGFLAIVQKTGALENGIKVLVKKLKGKELILIPILMTIFSIGGTTYGMLEETVGFYALLTFTMVAAGMDTIVASAVVLLGAGSGVLGSTINPFATGAAVAAASSKGIAVNQGTLIALGAVLWLVALGISIYFVMSYAKKVKADKGSTFLSLQEQKKMEKFKEKDNAEEAVLTGKQKVTLWIFGFTFLVMIIGFIPWGEFNIGIFNGWTSYLTGESLGDWWFYDAALWFLVSGIIIGLINKFTVNEIIDEVINGARDILSVVLIIAVARGVSVLMSKTYLDNYIIYNVADMLEGTPVALFTPCNFILHLVLSVLVPSSSGLATISTPIMAPLAFQLGYSVETTIMTFVAANGLVNLITPTCGAIMGGLALAKVNYTTWVKWATKVVILIGLASMLILTFASVILS